MLEALREGDYSMRGRNIDPEDAIGEVMVEVNTLSRTLHNQRLEALEAGVLLQKVIADVDIAVFAFDAQLRLRLVNRAGEALLGADARELHGRSAAELGLAAMLAEPSGRIVAHVFPGGAGRWEIRRRTFREGGKPHELLVIVGPEPRPARRGAAGVAAARARDRPRAQQLARADQVDGGHAAQAQSARSAAARLARRRARGPHDHPRPRRVARALHGRVRAARASCRRPRAATPIFGALVRRVASLHGDRVDDRARTRRCASSIDADQIEQALINLISNAVEAAGEAGGVRVRWTIGERSLARRRSRTTARASRAPIISGCRSSRPSPAAPASASCCRARSSRTTAASISLENRAARTAASRGSRCRSPGPREAAAIRQSSVLLTRAASIGAIRRTRASRDTLLCRLLGNGGTP